MSRVFLKQKNVFEQLLKEIAFCPAPGLTALLRPGKLWSLTVMLKIHNVEFDITVPPLQIVRQKPNVENYKEAL